MKAVACAAVLACACGGDGPHALALTVTAYNCEPFGRPPRAERPTVFIAGSARTELDIDEPSEAAAALEMPLVELRAGDLVVASLTVDVGADLQDCQPGNEPITILDFVDEVCELDSGDLRYASDECTTTGFVVEGDGGGGASCNCGSGERCTSIVVDPAPLYSHMGCAPIGSAAIGAPCTFTAGSDGMYDDCGSGAVCVGGTCLERCTDDSGCSAGSCSFIDGEPPEVKVCS